MRTMQISHLFFEMWADPSFKLQWGVPAELLPLPAVLPAVLLQLLWLFGLIPSHFPDIFTALTALPFCTVCCLWPDTSEKQESAQGLQLQDSVRPYHHLDTLNKLQLQEKNKRKETKSLHSTTLTAVNPGLFTELNCFDRWLDSWRDDQTSKPLTLLWQTVFCLGFHTIQVTHHRLLCTFESEGILDSCDSG